jgi:hypothetical protein
VRCLGKKGSACNVWVRKPLRKDLHYMGIILKLILKQEDGRLWNRYRYSYRYRYICSRQGKLKALVNKAISIKVPQNARNLLSSLGTLSFSRRTLLHGLT